jgi:glucose/arabinose dehydrogenase
MKKSVLLIFLFIFARTLNAQKLATHPQEINLHNKKSFTLFVPEGYHISVAAEGLKRPRFFSMSPDGRLFITDMYNRSDNHLGRIIILDQWNEQQHRFNRQRTYLAKLHNPNQILFLTRGEKQYLYVAETEKLSYYSYQPGDTVPSSSPTIIARFPDQGLDYKYGGWHLTRSLSFHNNKLYVSVGSSCNACIEKEKIRATILEMNPDGSDQKVYASGLRNSVGIKWIDGELWATCMGRDGIGPDKPEDLFQKIKKDTDYGWPYYFQYRKKIYEDKQFMDSAGKPPKPPVAPWGLPAHSAPLGFGYLRGFSDEKLNNSFLVALHGSTSVWRQRGNSVVQLMPDGSLREIVTGFLQGKTESQRFGRPCDVMQRDQNSFYISDDKNGVIYLLWKDPALPGKADASTH